MIGAISHSAGPILGDISVPGDKSISHRALILGALAVGKTQITGLLKSDDVLATATALSALGASIERHPDHYIVNGFGIGSALSPIDVLNMGNSGTAARLLIGVVSSNPITATFTGDTSLKRRPMGRIINPLSKMGACFYSGNDDKLPITVVGTETVLPIEYVLPMASAQVKSAILIAGLNSIGATTVIEPNPTRDHTETLLRHFGADVKINENDPGRRITIIGQPELRPSVVDVPGDPSSAAFLAVAALLTPSSNLILRNVGLNPLRAGIFDTLREMGGLIQEQNKRTIQGEPIADLQVTTSDLVGIQVPPERAPTMIDEYPILAIAAASAEGVTIMEGISELRFKESDRISSMKRGLTDLGIKINETESGMEISGDPNHTLPNREVVISTELDHRVAMSFLVYGITTGHSVRIDDVTTIETSFPGFLRVMNKIGANMEIVNG